MSALTVLFGGTLAPQAFEPVFNGKSAFSLTLERAKTFPGTEKVVLLAREGESLPGLPGGISLITRPEWTVSALLRDLSELSAPYELSYYAWADTPFLDPELAGKLRARQLRFAAEYSYADGWPLGLSPELLGPGTAGILYRIAGDKGDEPVERDSLFTVLQKDINAFDIETEISPVDLRCHRLSLCADSRRNLLLLRRFDGAGLRSASDTERIIAEHPEYLRTLPNFYSVQASGPCPFAGADTCPLCPYPRFGGLPLPVDRRKDFLDPDRFRAFLDAVRAFSGDAVIDLSLWGEIALHPERDALIGAVLDRADLSLVIETRGLGWGSAPEGLAEKAASAAPRKNGMAPLSWIVSLNPADIPRTLPGVSGTDGEGEAVTFTRKILSLFPKSRGRDLVYVQAIRCAGNEDAIEGFYRSWKALAGGPGVIIQKYDKFCGFLPDKRAVDLSPVKRRPCWHIMRDLAVLLDGSVPCCREDIEGKMEKLGNVFTDSLESIWDRGGERYRKHCEKNYGELCADCDEYYTYNF
ncbi:MAG: spiro-SPASM protein [Treponema sp.]|jgi:spiro-SPASM protein|nr:spiro-SPASM protein [Treponema sp.]